MQTEHIELANSLPGTQQSLRVLRFGKAGARPKVYIQSALHADELPGIVVAHALAKLFADLESSGEVTGEIVLVPLANPVGLAQNIMGLQHGRFDLRDGGNFNRGFAELAAPIAEKLRAVLTQNSQQNSRLIRSALIEAVGQLKTDSPAQDLKKQLLALAADADIVLDLHCDTDAVMHVYGLTPQKQMLQALGAALGAQAVLLATESGGSPFDEACTRPWLQLQKLLPEFAIELACFAATVELRGETDTDHGLAQQDARALVNFLAHQGALTCPATPLPAPLCEATPLSGSEPITAPCSGVVVFRQKPGDNVAAGTVIADMVDALTGAVTPVYCLSAGVLYARGSSRWASKGKRLAKIAGTSLARTGKVLSP